MSRKHFRVSLSEGKFVKLNRFENRLTAHDSARSSDSMTPMTPPQPKQVRLSDVWPWNEPRTRDLTIYGIPEDLILGFVEEVVKPNYPDGIVAAIVDLMEKAVAEQRRKRCSIES